MAEGEQWFSWMSIDRTHHSRKEGGPTPQTASVHSPQPVGSPLLLPLRRRRRRLGPSGPFSLLLLPLVLRIGHVGVVEVGPRPVRPVALVVGRVQAACERRGVARGGKTSQPASPDTPSFPSL